MVSRNSGRNLRRLIRRNHTFVDGVFGIPEPLWERLPLLVKIVIAIGFEYSDIESRVNQYRFALSLSEEQQHLFLQARYESNGYDELLDDQ